MNQRKHKFSLYSVLLTRGDPLIWRAQIFKADLNKVFVHFNTYNKMRQKGENVSVNNGEQNILDALLG